VRSVRSVWQGRPFPVSKPFSWLVERQVVVIVVVVEELAFQNRSYSRPSRPANYVDEVHSVADGIQSVTIGTGQTSEPGTFKMVNCHLNCVSVGLLLDLGAKVSIVNNKVDFNALDYCVTYLQWKQYPLPRLRDAQRGTEWCSYP